MSADSPRRKVDPRDPYYHANVEMHSGVVDWALKNRQVRLAVAAVKKASETGELAYSLIGGKRCYAASDIDDWLLGRRKPARTEQDRGRAVSA